MSSKIKYIPIYYNLTHFYSEKLPLGYRTSQRQDSRSSNAEKSKSYDAGKV